MAKTLLLIRHAKSSWDNPILSDFERPLNDRGKKDAPDMAIRLAERKITIDAFVSSPAKRAKQTSRLFAKEFDVKKKKIVFEPRLYEAGEENFYEAIQNLKNKWNTVAIVSHNPGITSFANSLTGHRVDDMPTSAVFAIKIDTNNWEDFREAAKEFWFFDFPKATEP